MKKRILALFAMLALCAGLFSWTLTAGAASSPCFMALNDNLLDLEDRYMPITVSGLYYVPYTVFDNTVTTISLGVYPIMNASQSTLSLYSKEEFLTFNLAAGNCSDRSGQVYTNARAVTRNGRVYLPARFVCEFFGLSYYSQSTQYGPLVRICSSSARLPDADFVDTATLLMQNRLNKWQQAQAAAAVVPTPAPTPTPAPSPLPTPAAPTPSLPPEAPVDEEENKSDVRAYLGIRCTSTQGLDTLLNSLARAGARAVFFFPADSLAEYDEAVRQVLCAGHSVGLLVAGTTAEEIAADAAEGNRLLAEIALRETAFLLAEDAPAQAVLDEAAAGGWLCWRGNVDALPDGRSASRQAADVLQSAGGQRYEVWLTLDGSAAGAALGSRILQGLTEARYSIRTPLETEF